jgi:beta-glucanase (GH16 family)
MIIGQICDSMGLQVLVTENGECDYNPWVKVFEDNFDYEELDESKWTLPYQGVIAGFDFSTSKQWYANTGTTPSIPISNNIEISNGILKLIAKKEIITGTYIDDLLQPPTSVTTTFDYSSARINSKYFYGYGLYEIRCKIPYGKGFFPAFWMFGVGENNVNNEIDVFEFWENNTVNHNMTAHYNGEMCLVDYNGPDYSQAFHTYTVIWDNYKMAWYVDGYSQNNLKRLSPKFWTLLGQKVDCNGIQAYGHYIMDIVFPRDPMEIITNLALQTGTYQPDISTPFPSSLEIDYIRHYKKINCSNNLNITNYSQLNLSSNQYNIVVGANVTIGGNVIIPNAMQLDIVSQEKIRLLPGFKAGNGSNIVARIDANICSGLNEFNRILS